MTNPTPEEAALHTMTEAFLRWPLPDSVCADLCATKQGPGRVGTNLLTVIEAEQMLKEVVMPLFIEFKHARLATRQIDWDLVEFLQRVQNGEMTCIKAAQYIDAKIESENARLQAALAEKEAELAKVGSVLIGLGEEKVSFIAQLAALQQRVSEEAQRLKELLDKVPEKVLATQRENPAWSKAQLWGIERDIVPSIRLEIWSALATPAAQAATEEKETMFGNNLRDLINTFKSNASDASKP